MTNKFTARVFARQVSRELQEEETIKVAAGKGGNYNPQQQQNQNPNQFQNAAGFNVGESRPNPPPTDNEKCWKTDHGGFLAVDCSM